MQRGNALVEDDTIGFPKIKCKHAKSFSEKMKLVISVLVDRKGIGYLLVFAASVYFAFGVWFGIDIVYALFELSCESIRSFL